jgi:hypothetical protein
MTRLRKGLIAALAGAILATSAQADVIYDNGTPGSGDLDGNDATQWVQAEDFTLAAGGTVTGAGVYIAGINGIGNWDGNFTYYLFETNGSNPGSVLQTGGVSVTPVRIRFSQLVRRVGWRNLLAGYPCLIGLGSGQHLLDAHWTERHDSRSGKRWRSF